MLGEILVIVNHLTFDFIAPEYIVKPHSRYRSGASEYLDDAIAQIRHPHSTRNVGYNLCYFFKDYCSPLFLFSLIGVGMILAIVNH